MQNWAENQYSICGNLAGKLFLPSRTCMLRNSMKLDPGYWSNILSSLGSIHQRFRWFLKHNINRYSHRHPFMLLGEEKQHTALFVLCTESMHRCLAQVPQSLSGFEPRTLLSEHSPYDSWPSGPVHWTQVLVLSECGFESRSQRLCPWARHLTIIASSFGWDVKL